MAGAGGGERRGGVLSRAAPRPAWPLIVFLVPLGKAYKKEMVNYSGTRLKFTMDKERKAFYWNFLGSEV